MEGGVLNPCLPPDTDSQEGYEQQDKGGSGGGFFLDTGGMDVDEPDGSATQRDAHDSNDDEYKAEGGKEESLPVVGFVLGGYYSVLDGKGIGIALCSLTKLHALGTDGSELAVANTAAHNPRRAAVQAWPC